MHVEQSVEWEPAGETEILGDNLPQCQISLHKIHITWHGLEPGPLRWEAGDQAPELFQGLCSKTEREALFNKLQIVDQDTALVFLSKF
jgi:hypothetical protein